eukprot:CAMPEP_0115315764 /NCGR_PEP_ID=MMETSP0270-20121206/77760_1 /TAXON_ID=71861 /ORGANISM="Scrippsiella trochoidea, Strain CCMP3099" /LENGTH=186 /DNA_ID=CAMNT_0002735119 /DNA_START=1 /DNA_END=561 /DNA_ORIENTATION=-
MVASLILGHCLLLVLCAHLVPTSMPESTTVCELPGCESSIEDVGLHLLQVTSSRASSSPSKLRDESAVEAAKARFAAKLWAGRRCEDGPGDRRGGECAEELCHKCLGPGAQLVFDPSHGLSGYTSCVYHPPPPNSPYTFCGESFGDGRKEAGAQNKCECCYGSGAWLEYVRWAADGLGYTYCRRQA